METTMLSIRPPRERTLQAFRNVFNNIKYNGDQGYPMLGGRSAHILDDPDDLVALYQSQEEDRLTSFLRYMFPVFFIVSSTHDVL